MEGILRSAIEFGLRLTYRLRWLAPLLMRLFLGYFFLETGWGKIHNLATFTQRFMEWGISLPAFNAALCALPRPPFFSAFTMASFVPAIRSSAASV